MYYGISQFSEAYNKILRNSSSHSSCQLVIFVSCLNIDALCATKMLSLLFKKQLVQSQIVPIFGYSELRRHYSQLDDNINSLLLVGFGGVIDRSEIFCYCSISQYSHLRKYTLPVFCLAATLVRVAFLQSFGNSHL